MPFANDDDNKRRTELNSAPPRPPKSKQSVMDLAVGDQDPSAGMDMSNPAVQVMKAMGDARNSLLKLSSLLPTIAGGIQQIIQGLEAVVPQQVADIVAGNPPGSSGSGMQAGGTGGAGPQPPPPQAPPVQAGAP